MNVGQKKKKKKILGAAALLAVAVTLTGTFAWITYNDQRINRVKTSQLADGSVSIIENWTPPTSWIPGTETTKEVQLTNTGEAPVLARISFEEVLKHLVSKGTSTEVATPYTTPATPALTNDIPVNFKGESYTVALGWTDISTKVAGITGTTKVMAKGNVVYDPSTSSNTTTFEYVVFNEYETGKFQKTTADITVLANPTAGSAVDTWTYNAAANVKYHIYAGGYKYVMKDWSGSNDLLGGAGMKYGVPFDYTLATTGVTALPTATPGAAPAGPGAIGDLLADADPTALGQSAIKVVYTDLVNTMPGTGVSKKWAYNAADGYFYYLSKINTGGTTEKLMDKLKFDSSAGKEYTNIQYDLVVKSEAIQAVPEALTDALGWNMNAADPATQLIIDELELAISK